MANKTIHRRFGSFVELVEYAAEWPAKLGPVHKDVRDRQGDGSDNGRSWYGLPSKGRGPIATCQHMLKHGWPEGLEKIQQAMAGLRDVCPPTSIKRRRIFTDQGDSVDLHRVYSGQLETAWQRCKPRSVISSGMVKTIAFPTTRSVRVDQSVWTNTGAAVLGLHDLLQDAGYSVRIIGGDRCSAYGPSNVMFDIGITVKEAGAMLESHTLAALVAHPVSMRGALYAAEYRAGFEDGFTIEAGLSSGPFGIPDDIKQGAIIVPELQSMEQARAWVVEQIGIINGAQA